MMNGRCIIITAYLESSIRTNVDISPDDYVICADGGFEFAVGESIVPDVVIGDFDSSSIDKLNNIISTDSRFEKTDVIRTRPEKDYTDTHMCVIHGVNKGFSDFVIIGGLGGRLDHTFANIQMLSYLVDNDCTGWMLDGDNKATMIQGPDELILHKGDSSYFSVYSFTEKCTGIYEINAKYPLEDATLTQSFPIGTSNEFLNGPATIKVGSGKLLIIKSGK